MTTKQVMYMTADGQSFATLEEAQAYEIKLQLIEIGIPDEVATAIQARATDVAVILKPMLPKVTRKRKVVEDVTDGASVASD